MIVEQLNDVAHFDSRGALQKGAYSSSMAFRSKVLLSGDAGLKKYSEKISEIWETICRKNIIHFLELCSFGGP
jgi:hypothetical protein